MGSMTPIADSRHQRVARRNRLIREEGRGSGTGGRLVCGCTGGGPAPYKLLWRSVQAMPAASMNPAVVTCVLLPPRAGASRRCSRPGCGAPRVKEGHE